MQAIREYDSKVDSKKRVTIRGVAYEYYHITEYDDGTITMSPRVLREPFTISENTLAMVDSSMENVKKGIVYGPVDLSDFEE